MIFIRCIFSGLWLLFVAVVPIFSQEKPVAAILSFHNTSEKFYLDEVAKSFPTLLKTELAQTRSVVIVEREKLDAVLKEQDFVLSDLSEDKDKQAKVGNLIGADYVITGEVSEAEGRLRIDVAVTRISSGQVIAEKVTGPSRKYVNTMARLLANNIAYELSGEGKKIPSMKLGGAPVTEFAIATLVLGGGAYLAAQKTSDLRAAYRGTTDLAKMNARYKKADRWNKVTISLQVGTAATAIGLVYAFIKNASSDREVLADMDLAEKSNFAVAPYIDSKTSGLNLSFSF